MRRADREQLDRALEALERLTVHWAEERQAERAFIEALERRHSEQVERLLGFLTSPEQAMLYARQREVELEDFTRTSNGSEFDELPVELAAREAGRRFVRSELEARGVSDEEIAAARAT